MTGRLRSDELDALRERDSRKGWRNWSDKVEQVDAVAAVIDRHRLLAELDAERDYASRLTVALHGVLSLAEQGVLGEDDIVAASRVMTGMLTAECPHPPMFRRNDGLCVVCGRHEAEFK